MLPKSTIMETNVSSNSQKNGGKDPQNELKWGQLLQQLPWRYGSHVNSNNTETFPKCSKMETNVSKIDLNGN